MDEWEDIAPKTPTAWRKLRKANVNSALLAWEQDDMFIAFALIKWPKDMVLRAQGGYKSQSSVSKLRHHYDCFETIWAIISQEDKDKVKAFVNQEDAA